RRDVDLRLRLSALPRRADVLGRHDRGARGLQPDRRLAPALRRALAPGRAAAPAGRNQFAAARGESRRETAMTRQELDAALASHYVEAMRAAVRKPRAVGAEPAHTVAFPRPARGG